MSTPVVRYRLTIHSIMAPFIGNAIPWPDVTAPGLSEPRPSTNTGLPVGGDSFGHIPFPSDEQVHQADAVTGSPDSTSDSTNAGSGEEVLDTIGEEEELSMETTTVPGPFFSTAVPPQMGGGVLRSAAFSNTPDTVTEEVLKDPDTSALAGTENLRASNQEVPGGSVTTDKVPSK